MTSVQNIPLISIQISNVSIKLLNYFRLAHMFGLSEEPFLRLTSEVIDAMVTKVPQVIRWPQENELDAYAAEYNTIGR